MLRPKSPRRGDDRVSGTDAERHDDIYHNGIFGFGGNADRAEMADLVQNQKLRMVNRWRARRSQIAVRRDR